MKKRSFSGSWKNRKDDLSQLRRYHKFKVMFYRTNLAIHYKRAEALLDLLLPIALAQYPDFDEKKSKLISRHHDDFELISRRGDVPLQLKLMMNGDELSELKEEEIYAAKKIARLYRNPSFSGGYKYEHLLMHAILKDCKEAQLHSFADKIDGYCEAIHEALAGNVVFLEPVVNYCMKTFNNLQRNFPLIEKLFNLEKIKNTLFDFPVIDLKGYFQKGNIGACPHTIETVKRKTSIPHYEIWKEVTLSAFQNGMDLLTKQVEFHRSNDKSR